MNKSFFKYEPDEKMYVTDDYISYSDGSEKYFIDLFNSVDVEDDSALLTHIEDWAIKYHLSQERINVISPFLDLFNVNGNVLEIGAGMGAISRWLGKNFRHVDCIEGNINRARALRARTRNMENVDIYAGNALKTNLNACEYDLATLIGVLEYIPFYSDESPEESVVVFLRNIHNTLNDNGILIISIENKFGLKYFSGCAEDHNGDMYSGLMDYPFKSAITFGRNELESLIRQAGFSGVQFYHAYPDYKMPVSVFRECSEIYELNPDVFWPKQILDNIPRKHLFFEPLVIKSLFKEKMVHYFSNSFVILCSKSADTNLKTEWVFVKCTDPLINADYRHWIKIAPDKNRGGFLVEKKALNHNEDIKENNVFSVKLTNQEYVHGSALIMEAFKAFLAKDNYMSFLNLLSEIRGELLKNSAGEDEEGYPLVSGCFFDFCFWNLIRRDGKLIYFDNKWNGKEDMPVDYIIFRNIHNLRHYFIGYVTFNNFESFCAHFMSILFPAHNAKRLGYLVNLETRLITELLAQNAGMASPGREARKPA